MTGLYMLDYGAGNVRSLVNAINHLGYDITYVKDPSDIALAEVKQFLERKKNLEYTEQFFSIRNSFFPV
jgi:hypothetical protein